jgi:Protein of unknown function (DUF2799)
MLRNNWSEMHTQPLQYGKKPIYIHCMSQTIAKTLNNNYLRVFFVLTFLALVVLFFTACGHSSNTCQELDWYEIGRQDGTRGANSPTDRKIEVACKASDQSLSEALYNNGFDYGAAEYCTPQNGFELGRLGKRAASICPPLLRDEFTKAYLQGKRATEIESARLEVSRRMQNLEAKLSDKSIDLVRRGLMNGEKLELQSKDETLAAEAESISSALSSVRK